MYEEYDLEECVKELDINSCELHKETVQEITS